MICEICKQDVSILGRHLNKSHKDISHEEYYNKYLKKDENEGICPTCGKPTKFLGLTNGYRGHCSTRCSTLDKDVIKKKRSTNLERYGVEETWQSVNNKSKSKETKKLRYGDENYINRDKAKKTNLERYGSENPFGSDEVKESIKETNRKKYGCDHPSQSKEIRTKIENTLEERYGDKSYRNYEKTRATKLERYGDENYNNIEKQKSTNKEKYGESSMFKTDHFKDKTKETMIDKYGVEHFSKSEEFKSRMRELSKSRTDEEKSKIKKKAEDTSLEKYGVSNPMQADFIKDKVVETSLRRYGTSSPTQSEEVKEKIRKTNIDKYRFPCTLQNKDIKKKAVATNIKRYGCENPAGNSKVQEKIKRTKEEKLKKFQEENDLIRIDNELIEKYGTGWFQCKSIKKIKYLGCSFVDKNTMEEVKEYFELHKKRQRSNFEIDVLDYVKSIYDGEIIENSRSIISPFELDLYLSELKLAIECDGYYWHSTNHGIPVDYHLNKTELCSENGIRLIHIIDSDWYNNTEKYKLFLKDLICKKERIYARDCEFKAISQNELTEFLDENHLQGSVNCLYRFALTYINEIVGVISFSKPRFNKKYDLELVRLCFKPGVTIVGGFSKLLTHSLKNIKDFLPGLSSIISYVDKSKFSGDAYISVGFEKVGDSPPSYSYYSRGGSKLSRYQAQKHKLKNILGDSFSQDKTEFENMNDAG